MEEVVVDDDKKLYTKNDVVGLFGDDYSNDDDHRHYDLPSSF